jgi:hypothetical protein
VFHLLKIIVIRIGEDEFVAQAISQKVEVLYDTIKKSTVSSLILSVPPESLLTPPSLPQIAHVALLRDLNDVIRKKGVPDNNNVPESAFGPVLEQLLRKYQSVADPNDTVILRLVVSGSDRVLHSILLGYCRIAELAPSLLKGVKILWYIVPFEDNTFSSFVARHDAWY